MIFEASAESRSTARELADVYRALRDEGFSENQAFTLVTHLIGSGHCEHDDD